MPLLWGLVLLLRALAVLIGRDGGGMISEFPFFWFVEKENIDRGVS